MNTELRAEPAAAGSPLTSTGPTRVWLNVHQGADYAGLSTDTIYTACERSELRHVRIGGRRTIRLRAEWIDAWLERHARGAVHSS